jgi:hypothetical protein
MWLQLRWGNEFKKEDLMLNVLNAKISRKAQTAAEPFQTQNFFA